MAKRTMKPCTPEQYKTLTEVIYSGCGDSIQPNPRIATLLVVEANTGLRIGDVLSLRRSSFVETGNGYRFNIIEEKTGKSRTFPIQKPLYDFLMDYAKQENIEDDEPFFQLTVRAVQKHLKKVCDYLGYTNISTHSFRKYFGTEVYAKSGCNIELVRRLYQHSSAAVTARYIGVTDKQIDDALNNITNIVYRPV